MENIVELRMGAGRTRNGAEVPAGGASILLFTGIRYVREAERVPSKEDRVARHVPSAEPVASYVPLDLAAH